MDILAKIEKLRLERNWSIYKLAEEAAIPQSTLANMFARKTLPSITTLQCLCEAFNVSMSEFFFDDVARTAAGFSPDEAELIQAYRRLNAEGKKATRAFIEVLLK